MESNTLVVVHVVDAMGKNDHLWGKERVIHDLMVEQRASGVVTPWLITLTPTLLSRVVASDGLRTTVLSKDAALLPLAGIRRLARLLSEQPVHVIHSHGYKANVLVRALRATGRLSGIRLISTCHGWSRHGWKLHAYNTLDRWTTSLSDYTTVPDPAMLSAFPRWARTTYVRNGVREASGAPPSPNERAYRGGEEFVVGTLGRIIEEKGIPEVMDVARACADPSMRFSVAGAGDLVERIKSDGPPNLRYVGYIRESEAYLRSLDVYLQASHNEGLSMSLLEAMRAGVPIVATDVGATREAIQHGETGLLVQPGYPDAILEAIIKLRRDPELAATLGSRAQTLYAEQFRMRRQHERFLELYAS